MSVRIRMKKMGRTHRPFYRICAMDRRTPRDGRVLEELGTYDPSVGETDARAILRAERIDYWLSVGAQPSDKCAVLIKKYGTSGTHVEAQQKALERLAIPKTVPEVGEAVSQPKSAEEEAAAEAAAAAPETTDAAAETAAAQPPAADATAETADSTSEKAATEKVATEKAAGEESVAKDDAAAETPTEKATEEQPAS